MTRTTVHDTSIAYELYGTGHPIVFVHGLGASQSMFAPQVDAFRHTHQVLTFDVRGAGRSGKLSGWRQIIERQNADLVALLDQLGLRQVVLCGVSYGGVFVQRFALDYTDRVAGLVVVDSFSETRPHNLQAAGLMLGHYLGGPAFLIPGRWLAPSVRRAYARWPLAAEHVARITTEMRGWETFKTHEAIIRINYTSELRRLQIPMLGVVGDASPLAVHWMRVLTDAIPGGRLEIVGNSFDPTNLCQPIVFNDLLADFLDQIGWARSGAIEKVHNASMAQAQSHPPL